MEVQFMKCVICGKEIEKSSYSNAILCSEECFYEHFWRDVLSDPETILMYNHGVLNAYTVGDENSTSYFRGFGGAAWYIQKEDGTLIKTTNLWHRGEVPEKYNAQANAKSLTKNEYEGLLSDK